MMDVLAFMPRPNEIFPETTASIADLRDLQRNPVYQNMVQRLRGAAYHAGATGSAMVSGLSSAVEILGHIEFEIQQGDSEREAKQTTADEIGFGEDRDD